jgi:hypothetical protein
MGLKAVKGVITASTTNGTTDTQYLTGAGFSASEPWGGELLGGEEHRRGRG